MLKNEYKLWHKNKNFHMDNSNSGYQEKKEYKIPMIMDMIILLYKCNKIDWCPFSVSFVNNQFKTYLKFHK